LNLLIEKLKECFVCKQLVRHQKGKSAPTMNRSERQDVVVDKNPELMKTVREGGGGTHGIV